MKNEYDTAHSQSIIGDNSNSATVGFVNVFRSISTNNLYYYYADGGGIRSAIFADFFLNLDNQWIHIVAVCDYNNKTAKSYRNGIQFDVTKNLTGTPVFPSTSIIKYIGANSSGGARDLTDGYLDEVRIYNRGLSAEEISAQYTSTKGKFGL